MTSEVNKVKRLNYLRPCDSKLNRQDSNPIFLSSKSDWYRLPIAYLLVTQDFLNAFVITIFYSPY